MSDCIDLVGVVVNVGIGCGIIWLARSSNKIAQTQNSIAARDVYLSVYDKLSEALGKVLVDGAVKDPAKDLFWQARDRARLELPAELEEYTQQLFDKMWEAYRLYYHKLSGENSLPAGEERSTAVTRHDEIIGELINERPHTVFERYMRIKV